MGLLNLVRWFKPQAAPHMADPLSLVHPAGRFAELLRRERMRADRSGRTFALVAFAFAETGDGERDRQRLIDRLEDRLRATDYAGMLADGRLGVLLADTDADGADVFAVRLGGAGATGVACIYDTYLYPGDDASRGRRRSRAAANLLGESAEERVSAASDLVETLLNDRPAGSPRRGTVQPLETLFVRRLPFWKRALDIAGACVGLVVLSPVMLTAAALVRLSSRGPVLFKQQRTGLGGRAFTMFKFRTMTQNAEALQQSLRTSSEQDGPAFKMTHDPRVTRVGRWLRKSCVDELPQLWNVLVGDMTLVGPRPLPLAEAAAVDGWQRRRTEVTPGLTCIWQVYGKSKVPFAEWMRMDIRYLSRRTLAGDLKLIGETMRAVVLHRASC
ncbi:MAG: sugar transferase [Planctomycetes bacterium]|nr:sugar transferase [Planctomycetota bacterium]